MLATIPIERRLGAKVLTSFAVVLLALLALGTSSAFATHGAEWSTSPRVWYTGSPGTKLTGTRTLTTEKASSEISFKTIIGGEPIEYTATGVECENCKIENKEGTGAVFTGELLFTGMKWEYPDASVCSIPTTLKTAPLTGLLGGNGGKYIVAAKIYPTTGTTWWIRELMGSECPIGGAYKWTGSAFAQFNNPLEVNYGFQTITFNQSIQEAYEPVNVNSLRFGENASYITGEIRLSVGEYFQVKES